MRQGGEPQGVQVVRQGEPTPYHCDFNSLYLKNHEGSLHTADAFVFVNVQAALKYGYAGGTLPARRLCLC